MFDISFRKIFFVLAVLGGGIYYAKNHYDYEDVYKWAKARPEHDSRAKSIYYIGMVYYLKDDSAKTAEVFGRLLEDHPTCQFAPKALLRLGAAHRNMNNFAEARAAYERYIEQFPNGPDIERVQANYEFVKFK